MVSLKLLLEICNIIPRETTTFWQAVKSVNCSGIIVLCKNKLLQTWRCVKNVTEVVQITLSIKKRHQCKYCSILSACTETSERSDRREMWCSVVENEEMRAFIQKQTSIDKQKQEDDIKTKRCAGRGGKMCQDRGRLRHFLSCGLIYGYWEHKSFTSIRTSSAIIHSPEHVCVNKVRNQKYLSVSAGSLRIPQTWWIRSQTNLRLAKVIVYCIIFIYQSNIYTNYCKCTKYLIF